MDLLAFLMLLVFGGLMVFNLALPFIVYNIYKRLSRIDLRMEYGQFLRNREMDDGK